MLSSIFTLALLSTTTLAILQEKRQATDAAQFTVAANELISKYIPSGALLGFESSVSSAANAAQITGDSKSLLYEALLASSLPPWFASAIPADYSSQIAALEGDINALRRPATGVIGPIVVPVTTTDSVGSTYTTSATSGLVTVTSTTGVATTTTATPGSGAGSTYSALTTEVVSGITSVFSTIVVGGGSVTTKITSGAGGVLTTIISGGSSVVSQISTGGGGVVSTISEGGSSVISKISTGGGGVISTIASGITGALSTATSEAKGAVPTAVKGAAVGVVGFVGMMIAL